MKNTKLKYFRNKNYKTYSIYGVVFSSNFNFISPLASSQCKPQLTFTITSKSPPVGEWIASDPIFVNPHCNERGESLLYVYEQTNYHVMHFTDVADFYIWDDHILCYLMNSETRYNVELFFLGVVLALWLELKNILTFHASAVITGKGTVMFLANNKGGKSSIAAEMVRSGMAFLSDDLVALYRKKGQFWAASAYPQFRFWPEDAHYFVGKNKKLMKVHPDLEKQIVPTKFLSHQDFQPTLKPLVCIYLLEKYSDEKGPDKIWIKKIEIASTLIELLRYSYIPNLSHVLKIKASRFRHLSDLARGIPCKKLTFPAGMQYLSEIRKVLLSDLKID